MLPDYDAKAVAEVLGLAFLLCSTEASTSTVIDKASKAPVRGVGGDRPFMFHVDDAMLLMVEARPQKGWAPFDGSTPPGGRPDGGDRLSSPSPVFIEKAVESGLPRKALRRVAEWLAGGDQSKIAAFERGVVPKTTLERREGRLSPQESERTERIARLSVHARRALGTEAEARHFMTTPHPELDGRSPLDAAMTDLGNRRAERLLTAREYGLPL